MKRKIIWNIASYAGLTLGLASTAYMFGTQLIATSNIPSLIGLLINSALWIAKFAGCIYLMAFFMRKVARDIPDADRSTTFKFGIAASLLSGLVYAAATFANIAYLNPDLMTTQYEQVVGMYKSVLDSNSITMLENMMANLPQISFFSNLIYCFIYGTLLSSILSRMIPANNPFGISEKEEK